jgi:hypothetical protein
MLLPTKKVGSELKLPPNGETISYRLLFAASIIQISTQQFRNVGYFTTFRPGRSILVAVEPLEIEWLGR